MSTREFGTCFFEQYAQITLSALLGREFDGLVNRDRPDLQSPDGRSLGVEVTRAMQQSKYAAEQMLLDVAGQTPPPRDAEIEQILENGYAFGLQEGKYIGVKELAYWTMALPLRHIIESKVGKVGNGFYGHFDKTDLFVFSLENLGATEALKAMNYTLSLQKCLDNRFDRLYLADVDDLFVCNLNDGLTESSRMLRYRISQEQRRDFYQEAVRRQNDCI